MGELLPPDGTARMAVRYDEFAIDLVFRWVGAAPALPRPGTPDPDSLLRAAPDEAEARLRTLLLIRIADTARVEQQHGAVVLRQHFDHCEREGGRGGARAVDLRPGRATGA